MPCGTVVTTVTAVKTKPRFDAGRASPLSPGERGASLGRAPSPALPGEAWAVGADEQLVKGGAP